MKLKKFCCDKFEILYSGESYMGLNIRVVSLPKDTVNRLLLNSDKSVFITEGYSGNISKCEKKVVIKYCPFCGENLNYINKTTDFIQENWE